jgi:hypothetical protein
MQVDAAGGLDIGQGGFAVEQQDQLGALVEVVSHRSGRGQAAGLVEELGRETWAVHRCGAGHGACP